MAKELEGRARLNLDDVQVGSEASEGAPGYTWVYEVNMGSGDGATVVEGLFEDA